MVFFFFFFKGIAFYAFGVTLILVQSGNGREKNENGGKYERLKKMREKEA